VVEALQAHLGALEDEIQATVIPGGCKQSAAWCIGQLPPLYALFRQTNESRYGEEITRLFQCVLKELTEGETGCPKARQRVASIPGRLHLLHEQLGLPRLELKSPGPSPRARKTR
jgi:hypothetical protein